MHRMKKFLIYDINSSMEGGYTEYGYRGLEEIKRLQKIIEEKEIELKRKNELLNDMSETLKEERSQREAIVR